MNSAKLGLGALAKEMDLINYFMWLSTPNHSNVSLKSVEEAVLYCKHKLCFCNIDSNSFDYCEGEFLSITEEYDIVRRKAHDSFENSLDTIKHIAPSITYQDVCEALSNHFFK